MTKTVHVLLLAIGLVSVVVASGACSGGADESASPAAPAEAAAPPAEERAVTGSSAPGADDGAAADAGLLASGFSLQPRVIQTASVSLTVPKGEFERTVDRARQIATSLAGFVTASSSSQGPDERLVRGRLVVRVPSDAYALAMSRVSELGKIVGREESGADVTLQYVDLESRARHLEALERRLLGFLDETQTVADALVVQGRLGEVEQQLEEVRGRLRHLDDQTSFATVSIEIAERGIAPAPGDGGGWGLGDAWDAAVNGIETIAGGALVALVTAGPILALLALAGLSGRALWRRRRPARAGSAGG